MNTRKLSIGDIIAESFQMITWLVLRSSFLIFGKLTVTGIENIKDIKGPVIFAPNHANDMDPLFLRAALPIRSRHTPLYFVTHPFKMYAKIASTPFTQLLYRFVPFSVIGAVPFLSGSGNYAASLQNHIELLRKGKSVCIFPEGTVTKDGSLGEPKGGVAYMAQASHAPIIPVAISGTFELTRKKFFWRRPEVTFYFSQPQHAGDIVPTLYPHKTRYHKAAEVVFKRVEFRRKG
jgi:1-acyl-sn-glycerol-3-phosphate acyltransferase